MAKEAPSNSVSVSCRLTATNDPYRWVRYLYVGLLYYPIHILVEGIQHLCQELLGVLLLIASKLRLEPVASRAQHQRIT